MSEERLERIEGKLDGLVGVVADLRLNTVDLTVGQATLEHRFDTLGTGFERMQREWVIVENAMSDMGGIGGLRANMERGFSEVLYRLDHRVKPLEEAHRVFASRIDDHEQRLQALENGRR